MTDLPPGDFTFLMIGHQWPSSTTLASIGAAQANRTAIETAYDGFADALQGARTGPLAGLKGVTAEDARETFQRGENNARRVAEKNGIKKDAYGIARQNIDSLRSELREYAAQGNSEIDQIKKSKTSPESKLAQAMAVVEKYQRQSDHAAGMHCDNVFREAGRVLQEDGGPSLNDFAKAHGIDLSNLSSKMDQKTLEEQTKALLNNPGASPTGLGAGLSTGTDGKDAVRGGDPRAGTTPALSPQIQGSVSPHQAVGAGTSRVLETSSAQALPAASAIAAPPSGGSGGVPGSVGPTAMPAASAATAAPSVSVPAASAAPSVNAPAAATQPLSPQGLAQSFNAGAEAGAPTSAGANALTQGAMHAGDSPLTTQAPPVAHAPIAPPPVSGPVYEVANAAPQAPVEAAPPPPSPSYTAAPMVVSPGMPAAAPPVAAAAMAPAGPLPAYGADLRPPIPTATLSPAGPLTPLPAAPSSAPTGAAAGQGGVGQPAVVQKATQAAQAPSAIAGEAAFATAGGAIAGAVSAEILARARLQRLVEAVARQQPRIAWAAGERADGTTVLATDLASGWVPPGIELPSAVQLLAPSHRRGDVEALLGQVEVAVTYAPGQYLPVDDDPPATSSRPRRLPDVDELSWELGQATHWRDGLPRLAHTLARAATTGTGILESEIELLHDNLIAVGKQVLDSYPGSVDASDVGNWQLLATIDALAAGDKTTANYHFAWFQALSVISA